MLREGADFQPQYIHDLIPIDERLKYNTEVQAHERLRDLLANHLQIVYQEGSLRWPRTRREIDDSHNVRPRVAFRDAGDLTIYTLYFIYTNLFPV